MSHHATCLIVAIALAACGPSWAEPGPSSPLTACPMISNYDIQSLAQIYGLSASQIDIRTEEANAQARSHAGEVCIDQALALALHSLFHDRDDPDSAAAMLDRYGRHFARHPRSTLRLARIDDEAPRGERASEAWLFVLSMPALSDHQYWAVVQRRKDASGQVAAYSYGCN